MGLGILLLINLFKNLNIDKMDGNIMRFPKKTLKENRSLQNLNEPMKKTQIIDNKNIDKNNNVLKIFFKWKGEIE